MLHLLETKMPFMTVVSHIEQPPIHSLAKVMTQFPLEVATPSHAKVPMEPLSNILAPPSTTILHPPPIEVPTPTIIKVLIDPPPFEVPISPSIHILIVPIDKVSTSTFIELPPISTSTDVCKGTKESSKTMVPKSFKSIMQVNKDDQL
jgi:hypothetical protein